MRYEASDQVFVAMPFSPPFQRAYEAVIGPAIKSVTVAGKPLQARVINRGTTGSPDIHEQIFDAIIHSRLVIADMTVQSMYADDGGVERWQANANVAYEVGLACAWRNPEDILLVHQSHPQHAYSFDVQNLRHLEYDATDSFSVRLISDEIDRALNTSSFIARQAFLKLVQSLSPVAIQYMHQESGWAFTTVAFHKPDVNCPFSCMIQAVTELLSCGALKNRNVIPQGSGKGVAVIYQWTELGMRLLQAIDAIDADRAREMRDQIKSVPEKSLPPKELRNIDQPEPAPAAGKTGSSYEAQKFGLNNDTGREESEKKPGTA
jgi:hypothetical protein